uniref:Uncharacterized protein n=1 Tax=Anguilla anguilla TaxID=7936 RepID=A0A0E9PIP7_ANGAN
MLCGCTHTGIQRQTRLISGRACPSLYHSGNTIIHLTDF